MRIYLTHYRMILRKKSLLTHNEGGQVDLGLGRGEFNLAQSLEDIIYLF